MGAVGDMGIHNTAMAWMGLQLGLPDSGEVAATSGMNTETFHSWLMFCVNLEATFTRPAVPIRLQ